MKSYLIDTHIVLWLMFDSNKISESILNEIKNIDNKVYISAVSFWEISIKFNLGKLNLDRFSPSDLSAINEEQGFQILPITAKETSTLYQLESNFHKDPFDRMLIWQAISNNYILITNDINMKPYQIEGLKLLWYRINFQSHRTCFFHHKLISCIIIILNFTF